MAETVGAAKADRTSATHRCFYTLWGRDGSDQRIWETVPDDDLVGTVVEGTGRQDWRLLRPFDLLPELAHDTPGSAHRLLYEGEALRVACEALVGPQPGFERAGDFDTILFQVAGYALVETSFGRYELSPGEALHIPPMVAHRAIGSNSCRQMVFLTKDRVEVMVDPDAAITDTKFEVVAEPGSFGQEMVPPPVEPSDGKVLEHLSHWDGRPGEAWLFQRTYEWMVGKAEQGPDPTKVRPFDYFTTPPESSANGVRSTLLWESPTFRQKVYANPGRQPAPHRGYDEDELWFQFAGQVDAETEHGAYSVAIGEMSMAEAGISHTSQSYPGVLRLTTYTNKTLRMVVDPADQIRHTQWAFQSELVRGWPSAEAQP